MREITVYSVPNESTSPKWSAAFIRGFPGKVTLRTEPKFCDGPFAMFGSPKHEDIVRRAKTRDVDWYFGDHGFFGRGEYYRCARNATMFDGTSGDDEPTRFLRFCIPVKDWRKTGKHIVVCPNSAEFLQRNGSPNWVSETVATLKRHTDRPIKVRWKKEAKQRPLALDLIGAWTVVTFMSNASVGAVLDGIPAFCTRPCAGLSMGSNDLTQIENPRLPDGREQWAARLANNQWTLAEMECSALWKAIGR